MVIWLCGEEDVGMHRVDELKRYVKVLIIGYSSIIIIRNDQL